jgi:hypothetical protein
MVKPDHHLYKGEIERRGISCLVHFTTTINLLSIFEQGHLLSRAEVDSLGLEQPELAIKDFVVCSDLLRLDGRPEYINLSIEAPNSMLLKAYAQRDKSPWIKWCVIRVDPMYLYHANTLFAVTNAASRAAKEHGIGGHFSNFTDMFAEAVVAGARTTQRGALAAKYPTDIQAEVLVKARIPLADVINVCFASETDLAETRAAFKSEGLATDCFVIDKSIFLNNRV